MRTCLLLLAGLAASVAAFAQVSSDVWQTFSDAAEALANDDASAFLAQFDSSMPGYTALRMNVEALLNANQVISTIDARDARGQRADVFPGA